MTDAAEWHKVADVDSLDDGRVRAVTVDRRTLAVCRVGDEYGALDNRCPHQGGPACEGIRSPRVIDVMLGNKQMGKLRRHALQDVTGTVVELDGAPGTFGCDYGQPGYIEATVDLERPIDVLTESALGSRAEWKLASLQSLVRLNGWQMRVAK